MKPEPKPIWKKVATLDQLKAHTGKRIKLKNNWIALFKVGKKVFACQDACPHRGAPLSDGPLTGSVVTCTWHGWEFDLERGCHIFDDEVKLKMFDIQIKDRDIYINFKV